MRFSCKSHIKELEGNETVSVERELVPWPAFSAADDSGKIGFVDAKCGVDGKLSPSVEDYTCTRDCQAPQIDRSIMVGSLIASYSAMCRTFSIFSMCSRARVWVGNIL